MNNWSKEENLKYLKDKITSIRTAMLTTHSNETGFHSRPMGTADVDDDGNIWFFTDEYSPKATEIEQVSEVSVTYSDPHHHTYLSIAGEASFIDDKEKMKELFNPFVKAFFPEGLDDPRLTLIKIKPSAAEYWDSSSSKMVILFNMLKAVVTGKQYDKGKHGSIEV